MPDLQRDLIIDDEFTTLIRPLTNEEYHQLEENILREGCRESLVIWKNIILDGHNRYKICRRWNLPWDRKMRVANMLPAVVLAVIAAYLPWSF